MVNSSSPDSILIFSKTVKGSTHACGWFWNTTDDDYKVIRQWIAEGAQNKSSMTKIKKKAGEKGKSYL